MTAATQPLQGTTLAGEPSFFRTARVLVRLTWARAVTPLVLVSMLFLVLLPVLFGLAYASRGPFSGESTAFLVSRYDQLVLALSMPLIALLLATSAFSAESEDGTLLYLVTTTTPRWWIVTVRLLLAGAMTALVSAATILLTGYLVQGGYDPDRVTPAFALSAAYGGLAYAALFTPLALVTRRGLVTGLGYVLFWEGVFSNAFPGIKYLSVRQWTLAVAAEFTQASDERLASGPSITVAVVGGVLLLVVAIVVASRELHRPRVGRT